MRIEVGTSLQLADAVLAAVRLFAPDGEERVTLEHYANGREQGYAFHIPRRQRSVVFAGFRSSDSIVVYLGAPRDFAMAGNVPSDEVYKLRRTFQCGQVVAAARYIVGALVA